VKKRNYSGRKTHFKKIEPPGREREREIERESAR
jgi:hypothetical protein